MSKLTYTVGTFRAAGLECKWTKARHGEPIIVARTRPGHFYVISASMFDDMQRDGIREAFDSHTLLGDIFSIPA